MRIKQLSNEVANQIAAGEVIERPASVVKELLENALDAKASHVYIEVDFGGLNRIKVSDNGIGILVDDLPLAIAAHATSKLHCLNDLYAIDSMGFRGEALASIASVSRLTLISKPDSQAHAMQLSADSGKMELTPCARSTGTTIEVRDLFYNAPVRKKFLKSGRCEYAAIEAVVKRFALSRPHVALSLSHNGKQTLLLPACTCDKSMILRIRKLLGKAFVEQSIYLDVERLSLRLRGWISNETYQRSQNDKLWIYVNHRMVKDKLIHHAVKQAYEHLLHPGRYPACVLYFFLPANELDVNVHPTKHEVRFQQPRLVHDFILSQLVAALGAKPEPDRSYQQPLSKAPDFTQKMEVREPYRNSEILYGEPNRRDNIRPWTILNERFILLFLQDKPLLVDLKKLKQRHLKQTLHDLDKPWPSRPLLVPVRVHLSDYPQALDEQRLFDLAQLGMQVDFLSEQQAVVRSIPQALPQLNIHAFLKVLGQEASLSVSYLSTRLIDSCPVDARQLSKDEQEELTCFLQQVLQETNGFEGSKELTPKACETILQSAII